MAKTPPANALFFKEPKTLVKQCQDSYKLSNDRWMAPSFDDRWMAPSFDGPQFLPPQMFFQPLLCTSAPNGAA